MHSILVTGGTGTIGKAVVRKLAHAGYGVLFTYHRSVEGAALLEEELTQKGHRVLSACLDHITSEVADDIVRQARDLGTLRGLVNLAAVSGERKPLFDVTAAEAEEIWRINFLSTLLFSQSSAKVMSSDQENKGGSIVNFSSQAATSGGYRLVPYAASKGAVETLTVSMASELGEHNIRVNAISPGIVESDSNDKSGQETTSRIPLNRTGLPDEVADVVLWLVSEDSSYVTGTILNVNGGRRA